MRITGGNAARRILKTPKGLAVRPTPDLVKQAVFNSLGARVAGARVLELFAGTGALSLECLSRGAASSVDFACRFDSFFRKSLCWRDCRFSGVVKDPAGELIPEAQIMAINKETAARQTTLSDAGLV